MSLAPITSRLTAKRSVVERALDLLDCFVASPDQSIASLADQTGLPPATVHRLLASLAERDIVERSARGHYRLGMRLWQLGWGVPDARQVRDVARPFMVDLYADTREMVLLASRDADDIVVVDQIAGQDAMVAWCSNRRVPLGASAPGHLFLAHLPAAEVAERLRETSLGLPATLRRDQFRRRQWLADVRAKGFAVTQRSGRAWVAAPILDGEGQVRSTLSLVVPDERLAVPAQARLVIQVARRISARLNEARRG